jgi:hypothetical protein
LRFAFGEAGDNVTGEAVIFGFPECIGKNHFALHHRNLWITRQSLLPLLPGIRAAAAELNGLRTM